MSYIIIESIWDLINRKYYKLDPIDDRKFKSLVKPDGPDRLFQEARDPGRLINWKKFYFSM